jgi:ubiquinol-cytochrome c reductase cytochrome c subunit
MRGRQPAVRAHELRGWLTWAVLGMCVAAVAVLTGSAGTAQPRDPQLEDLDRGGELYQRWCATCHATDGTGRPEGPTLETVSVAELDLVMRTGRMPLADPERGVRDHRLDDDEREAVVDYLTDLLGLEGALPEPSPGDPGRGQEVYTVHCAACHGSTGGGGVAGGGVTIPGLRGLDPVTLAAATRVGPFQMPPFDSDVIDDEDLDDLVTYTSDFGGQQGTPLGLVELHRVTAAAFAGLLVALLVAGCGVLTRWPAPRREEENPDG